MAETPSKSELDIESGLFWLMEATLVITFIFLVVIIYKTIVVWKRRDMFTQSIFWVLLV